jgi:flagellar biosynthesis/type III secretory pathway M-ring protein FliF/YscJ
VIVDANLKKMINDIGNNNNDNKNQYLLKVSAVALIVIIILHWIVRGRNAYAVLNYVTC